MREAQQIWDELLQHHIIRNVCIDVEKEEIKKGKRSFEKSSETMKKKRIQKVSSRFNNRGRNSRKWFKNSYTSYQFMYEVTSLGIQKQNPCSKLIHAENIGAI
jgi:hypothetical protein